MTRHLLRFSLVAATLLFGKAASASVCAQIDDTRDTLIESDRNATRVLFPQALQQQGLQVVAQGCTETYVVYHVKLGNSITVFMQGPQGYRQAPARSIEEIPSVYSQLIRALITNQPVAVTNGVVDRTNVTSNQQAPRRVEADSLWYARLGYGALLGSASESGPAIGFGYRYELDNVAIDLSFFNLVIASNNNPNGSSGGVNGSYIKLAGLYFLNPTANASTYIGGGVSWGGTALVKEVTSPSGGTTFNSYTGSGLQLEVSAGYEFLRASTIRMFAQIDASLPAYRVTYVDYSTLTASTSKGYAATIAASIGIGWGRSAYRVNVIQ